jgi:hypothetical protein
VPDVLPVHEVEGAEDGSARTEVHRGRAEVVSVIDAAEIDVSL